MTQREAHRIDAHRVDAHHHVWDLAVRPQTWMVGEALAPITRSFGVDELEPQAAAAGVRASVVVQTVPDATETPELLALAAQADHGGLVAAVVGWVDLTAVDVADRIAALRELPGGGRLSGLRHQVHDEPDPQWLCRDDVRRGVRAVGEAGLVYDLLLRPPHLPAALATVRALPDQLFVVDHAAKPRIAAGRDEPAVNDDWREGIRALAACPNVLCKLSGLLVEADWEHWRAEHLRPYADVVLDAFGTDRVMIGSDWPVCLLAGSYTESLTVYDAAFDALSVEERSSVFAVTAARTYRIDQLPG
jgi:L-fuconolactonase